MSSSEIWFFRPVFEGDSPELPFVEALQSSSVMGVHANPQPLRIPYLADPQAGDGRYSYNRRAHGYRLSVVMLRHSFQYSLPLKFSINNSLSEKVTQLNNYLPRARLELMKHSFWSLVVREPGLRRLANNLREIGKPLIGDVVQMTRDDLINDAFASQREISLLVDRLLEAELTLGTKIANWSYIRSYRSR